MVEGVDYVPLFKILSDKDVFNTLVLLYRRENKPFTLKLLQKSMNLSLERADEILESLIAYKLIEVSELEIDDEVEKIFSFIPNPAFVALLAFSKELISKPGVFYHYCCDSSHIQFL